MYPNKNRLYLSPKISQIYYLSKKKKLEKIETFFLNICHNKILSLANDIFFKTTVLFLIFSFRFQIYFLQSKIYLEEKNDMRPRFRYVWFYNVFLISSLIERHRTTSVGRYIALKKNFSFDGNRLVGFFFIPSIRIFVHPHSLVFVYRSGWWRHCVIYYCYYIASRKRYCFWRGNEYIGEMCVGGNKEKLKRRMRIAYDLILCDVQSNTLLWNIVLRWFLLVNKWV